jgi:hypothetical protein
MENKMIKLSKIKPNPDNPRLIRDEKFARLVENIRQHSELMPLRPIVIDSWDNPVILGGNMRFRAIKELGYKEIPETWVKTADQLSEADKKAFIVLDNVSFGEWNDEMLANQWDTDELRFWGVDIPKFVNQENEDEPFEESGFDKQWFVNIRCDNEKHAQRLYERFINEGLEVKIVQ